MNINLIGEVNTEMAKRALPILQDRPKRLDVFLLSEGGDVSSGLMLYDTIKSVPESFIVASGLCSSAAVIVLQAGTHRLALPTTQFIVHEVRSFIPEPIDMTDPQIPAMQAENAKVRTHLSRTLEDILVSRMGYDNYNVAQTANIIDADTALRLHLIDAIYDPGAKKPPIKIRFNPGFVQRMRPVTPLGD